MCVVCFSALRWKIGSVLITYTSLYQRQLNDRAVWRSRRMTLSMLINLLTSDWFLFVGLWKMPCWTIYSQLISNETSTLDIFDFLHRLVDIPMVNPSYAYAFPSLTPLTSQFSEILKQIQNPWMNCLLLHSASSITVNTKKKKIFQFDRRHWADGVQIWIVMLLSFFSNRIISFLFLDVSVFVLCDQSQ